MSERRILDVGYAMIERLNEGANGIVFRGKHKGLDRDVAIKVLQPRALNVPIAVDRFLNEAKVLARFDHTGIVRLYDLEFDKKVGPYMVFEMLEGETLRQRIEREGLPSQEKAVEWMSEVLAAVAHCHSKGVIHRDLKPGNIWFTKSGPIKLIDFGFACDVSVPDAFQTRSGSPSYGSPEQRRGERGDERSDIYAAGAILFGLFSGELPYEVTDDGESTWRSSGLRELPPGLSAHLRDAVLKAISDDPADRFQSAEEFRAALKTPS